ncbi:MAG TPA: sodium:proton antiporter [Candidatus Ratteibacteria bacterium]|nr:sodium:proton antiporter [bacterium]HQL65152.1 sodium:proton antiporter [bacterium]HRS05739.1 sodium:proton antiporter [Candidatus Ratteibacteria bacterium]HRV03487.1 sodium:proton antiporter [Candidatus Ratteibacteria bacterium]
MVYTLCFILFVIGLYGVTCKKNIVKIILGFLIMEYSVNLFLILLGWRKNGVVPIVEPNTVMEYFKTMSVDPLPQAMVLISIVTGLGTLILMVALAIRLYQRYGTFDITEMNRLKK